MLKNIFFIKSDRFYKNNTNIRCKKHLGGRQVKITEQNYLKLLRHGNEAALMYVMEQYGGLVKSVVRKHLYNLSQYEDDCINDIFYAVWTHISSYDQERSTFANWLAGVARLKALDYVRAYTSKLNEVHIEEPVLENIPDKKDSARLNQALSDEMKQMLACLKEKDRELFYRLYVQEESMEEIERQMQIDRTVIYNRLSRSKKKIRKIFGRA